jgi:probable HAF family extracellular repeat protein
MKSRLLGAVSACAFIFHNISAVDAAELFSLPLVQGVSHDGSIIVGGSYAVGSEAYRWTRDGGFDYFLSDETGIDTYVANGISSDGSTIFGVASISGVWNPYRWTDAGGIDFLSMPSNYTTSRVNASSYDGSIVVSTIIDENAHSQAAYWDANGNVHLLPELPSTDQRTAAVGVSADGSIIVGEDKDSNGDSNAVYWENSASPTIISGLPGTSGITPNDVAYDVSSDGSVIVGWARNSNGDGEAFRWTEAGGMQGLGDLPGDNFFSWAYGVSGDGSRVVGRSHGGTGPWGDAAFLWTEDGGMVDLNDIAASLGLSSIGHLTTAGGISGDGTTIFGDLNASNTSYVLVTTVPIPPALYLFGTGLIGLVGMARRKAAYFHPINYGPS